MLSVRLLYILIALAILVVVLNVLLGKRAEHAHPQQVSSQIKTETLAVKPPAPPPPITKWEREVKTSNNIQSQVEVMEPPSLQKQRVALREKTKASLSEKVRSPPAAVDNTGDKETVISQQIPSKPEPVRSIAREIPPGKGFDLSGLRFCKADVQQKLDQPVLSEQEFNWCRNALDPNGGAVKVGESWGNLKAKEERNKFEALNCNTVSKGRNPSCNDAWGDSHVKNWRKTVAANYTCKSNSGMRCFRNDINDMYCSLDNARINFSKYRESRSSNKIPSRSFEKDFLTIDCDGNYPINDYNFKHLMSTKVTSECEEFVPGTTFLYSHDNIRNLCHTWNDVMNVWLMMWLEDVADKTQNFNLLTIDAMKLYNNFDDLVNDFFSPYRKYFQQILRGKDYGSKTVCFEKLVLQPLPSRGFVWENWHQDLPCSFIGPSSLFQRWNVQVREAFQVLHPSQVQTTRSVQVLLIVRKESHNEWGSYRTSRLFKNSDSIVRMMEEMSEGGRRFTLVVKDMASVKSFAEQVQLLADTSIVVAMHGAGLVQSMYMSIGTNNCCGVVEIFPLGEFSPVRGYANMMRKMGLHYERIDIDAAHSHAEGAEVPISTLKTKLESILNRVVQQPSCILPIVADNPYLH